MALAKLEFDLKDPEQAVEHKRCIKASEMAYVLFEIKHNLMRNMFTGRDSVEYMNGAEDTVRQILVMMKDLNLDPDELS